MKEKHVSNSHSSDKAAACGSKSSSQSKKNMSKGRKKDQKNLPASFPVYQCVPSSVVRRFEGLPEPVNVIPLSSLIVSTFSVHKRLFKIKNNIPEVFLTRKAKNMNHGSPLFPTV